MLVCLPETRNQPCIATRNWGLNFKATTVKSSRGIRAGDHPTRGPNEGKSRARTQTSNPRHPWGLVFGPGPRGGSPTGPQATGKFAVLPSEEGPQISQNKTKIKQQLSDQQKKAWPHPSDQELRRAFSDQKNSSMTGLRSQASLCLSSRKRRTDYFSQVLATSFYSFCQLERQEKLLLIWQSGLHGLRLFCVYS